MLKLPAWKFLKAETSTADAIGEQLGQLDRAYAEADAELSRLAGARPALLLDVTAGADAALVKHDAEMTGARRVLEATAARRTALEIEWRAAEAREAAAADQAERDALYKEALAGDRERARLYADYERLAADIAAKLDRIDALDRVIFRANEARPDGKLSVGFHLTGNRSRNGFLSRVALPSLSAETPAFWSGAEAAAPRLTAEETAILRFHGHR